MAKMETFLRGLLLILGAASVVISLGHIALGPEVIPGSVPGNATMDNQDRFFAALFLCYGGAVLWCLKDWRSKLREIRVLAAILFVGGLARLVSIAIVGLPHPFYVTMMIVEFVLPVSIVWASAKIMRSERSD